MFFGRVQSLKRFGVRYAAEFSGKARVRSRHSASYSSVAPSAAAQFKSPCRAELCARKPWLVARARPPTWHAVLLALAGTSRIRPRATRLREALLTIAFLRRPSPCAATGPSDHSGGDGARDLLCHLVAHLAQRREGQVRQVLRAAACGAGC